MAELVKFKYGSKSAYAALETKDPNTLYFVEGTLFKGTQQYGGSFADVASLPAAGVQGVLYINTSNLSVSRWDGTAYQYVVPPIVKTVAADATDDMLPTAKAVYSALLAGDQAALAAAKAYADGKVAELVGGAPETLDTIYEIAAALKDNADIIDVLNTAIGLKADAATVTSDISKAKQEAVAAAGTALGDKIGDIGAGSVKAYVDGKESALKARMDTAEGNIGTIQGQIATINGTAATDGSIAKALADAKVYTDASLAWGSF